MKTKVNTLGDSKVEEPKNTIQFTYGVDDDFTTNQNAGYEPWDYHEVTLIAKDYCSWKGIRYDLMVGHGIDQPTCLFLGHFNDGII